MDLFKDVGFTWNGVEYVVPADKVMGLVAVIEEVITIEELVGAGVKRVKMAKAFAAALRYAGARNVNDEEIYQSLFHKANSMVTTTGMVTALLKMMVPPNHLQTKSNTNGEGKKPPTARKKPAQKRSRKRT